MENKYESSKKVKKPDGTVMYLFDNKLHNWDEAALIHPNGKKEYYINNIQYSLKDWKKLRKNRTGLPWYKSSGYKSI